MVPPLRGVLGRGNEFFCSELVATVLRDAGVLDRNVNPGNVVPADFASRDRDGDISRDVIQKVIPIFRG